MKIYFYKESIQDVLSTMLTNEIQNLPPVGIKHTYMFILDGYTNFFW
jgi:hypothetical protein